MVSHYSYLYLWEQISLNFCWQCGGISSDITLLKASPNNTVFSCVLCYFNLHLGPFALPSFFTTFLQVFTFFLFLKLFFHLQKLLIKKLAVVAKRSKTATIPIPSRNCVSPRPRFESRSKTFLYISIFTLHAISSIKIRQWQPSDLESQPIS